MSLKNMIGLIGIVVENGRIRIYTINLLYNLYNLYNL